MGLINFGVSLFMVMRELGIGLRPDTFSPIKMVDNKVPTQGYLKIIFPEVYKEKSFKTFIKAVACIHIKIVLIIIIQTCNHNFM